MSQRMHNEIASFEVEVTVQTDGTLVARSASPPILVAARDSRELVQKLSQVSDAIRQFLDALGEEAASAYLEEVGLQGEAIPAGRGVTVAFPFSA